MQYKIMKKEISLRTRRESEDFMEQEKFELSLEGKKIGQKRRKGPLSIENSTRKSLSWRNVQAYIEDSEKIKL